MEIFPRAVIACASSQPERRPPKSMLFIQTRISEQEVDGATRLLLLEKLQEKGLVPLIRAARLTAYELALLGPERAGAMERAIAARMAEEDDAPYARGDLFCFEDFTLFLIFGEDENEAEGIRAGIVYETGTTEPQQKLDAFCRNVSAALEATRSGGGGAENSALRMSGETAWKARPPRRPAGFARFAAAQAETAPAEAAQPSANGSDGGRVAELLQDGNARRFLRRLAEAHAEGRTQEFWERERSQATIEPLSERLAGAGLLRREVLVVCRQGGRALFRLPSAEALAVLAASNAVCSECGANVADEKVEELIAPTPAADAALADGSWMIDRLRRILREQGIPDDEMVVARSASGEASLLANAHGDLFLFILRDGDWTGMEAWRALDQQLETEASHLVVIATGAMQGAGRARLRERLAQRRGEGAGGPEVIMIEGFEAAPGELQHAFERVSHRVLAEELRPLNSGLGLNVGHLVSTRFRMLERSDALKDLAASAAGALAGSLQEI